MDRNAELKELEQSLLGIIAAITQMPSSKVRKARLASNIATAKVTGIATSAGIFSLVSTFGVAGTLTPIGTLSGAAATNATLAWIGGLVGGGMAAGALLLPAVGIAAGTTATIVLRRKVHGRPRKLEELMPFEDEILFSADNLIRPLDAISKGENSIPTPDELRIYAHDGLIPLMKRLNVHLGDDGRASVPIAQSLLFESSLKPKYLKQLKRHSLTIAKYAAAFSKVERKSIRQRAASRLKALWSKLRRKSDVVEQKPYFSSVVLAVTFQRLLADKVSAWSLEQGLVLDALRRSTKSLESASIEKLSDYVTNLSPEQLKGVVSNTKGIYHEMLFVEMYNSDNAHLNAKIMDATNFPGADVQFYMEGELVREVQLKAISSPTLVYEHLQRYPDIEILVTEEVASILEGVESSGLNNAILSKDVTDRMIELQREGLLEEISDGLITSVFVTSGVLVYRVLKLKSVKKADFKPYLANAGIAVGTASVVEGVISLIGN